MRSPLGMLLLKYTILLGTLALVLLSSSDTAEARDIPILRTFQAKRDQAPSKRYLDIDGLTNAQRLARGLPPRKPATRTGKLRARTSSRPQSGSTISPITVPTCQKLYRAVIQVSKTDGQKLGFVGTLLATGVFGVTNDAKNVTDPALIVNMCFDQGSWLRNLAMENPTVNFTYIGGVTSQSGVHGELKKTSADFAFLAGVTDQVAVFDEYAVNNNNSYSDASLNTGVSVESAIWKFDPTVGDALTPYWTEFSKDGPQKVKLAWNSDLNNNQIVFTGDLDIFNTNHGPHTEVLFSFASIPS